MRKHSVLIIGCGSIGERHLRCFQQTGRAEPTACESDPALLRRMAETYGVPTAADWERAIAGGSCAAVVICTPAHLHIPMALRALAAGRHVLIEKPLSQSLGGVDELLRAQRRPGLQTAVGYTHRSLPFLKQARAFMRAGEIGPIREAWAATGQPFHLLRPGYPPPYYRDHATGGGAIQDALTHTVNWVESVVGPVDSVLCDCAHLVLPQVEVEDAVHVSARHGGTLVSYALNQFQLPNEATLQFNGVRGSVKIEYQNQRWGDLREVGGAWTWHEARVPDRDSSYIAQANSFLDQIEGRPPELCSIEEAVSTLRFNLAALASAKTGARVHCRDIRA